ncbi:phosphoglucosamine mutase [Seleniivibrio woodruffii]|uniref:Phosphoglucosamine mutase n=2 Tax=Seleniivibrio woodruffii TaxID=1078050 RepID=A0A4R1K921_9BACT|nr:phosphoglucosamine mutase [Seleniivibrio woodruffii]TCK60862.1 phosphoglucosamine mutase [Seleniivibrio woodruffii]TVZ36492.1 phosphoglucosamine mutase [Seleniivibrio woodruffii]
MRKYFGTDGVRGLANQFPMTATFALRLGQAAARQFYTDGKKTHRIVIGKDTRISGYMFESALVAGITSMGMDAVMVGVLPTPAIAFITRSLRADAGVVISASHNPYYDNGIKFFSGTGHKLPDQVELQIEQFTDQMIETGDVPLSADKVGKAYRIDTAIGRYVEFAKNTFDRDVDLVGLKIVVDCSNGATYKVGPLALEELGAKITVIGNQPNGTNINDKCGSVYPELMCEAVKEKKADIGIAFDGDGDRVIFSDGDGEVVDGDIIMGICAKHMKELGLLNGDTMVSTVMSNLGFERSMNNAGIEVVRTEVGDRYVMAEMLKSGYNLGGEQSGHIIFSDYNTTGDGLVSAMQLLKVLVKSGKSLKDLKNMIELYPQTLKNYKVNKKIPLSELPKTTAEIASVEKVLGKSGRVFVRYSGTENKIRVMLEGADLKQIEEYAENIGAVALKEIEELS